MKNGYDYTDLFIDNSELKDAVMLDQYMKTQNKKLVNYFKKV